MTIPKVSQEARELLPCPFCGGEADIVARNNPMSKWRWSVDCRGSTCGMSGPVESSRATAIALWNTRPESLIRSMVIDEAAGVLKRARDEIERLEYPYIGESAASVIADIDASIRQLGERGR